MAGNAFPGVPLPRRRLQGNQRRLKQRKENPVYEKSYEKSESSNTYNGLVRGYLLYVFTTDTGNSRRITPTTVGRVLSRIHDSRRVYRAQVTYQRRWKYGTWLAFALCEHQRQLQHRCWRWDTDSQQWGFQYGHWRCSAFAQYRRHAKHRRRHRRDGA